MTKEEILEKIMKVKALAEQGKGGEREVAQQMLQRLMEENDISETDIAQDVIKVHEFWYEDRKPFTKKLLVQIIYSVVGDINDEKGMYAYAHSSKGRTAIKCTDAEFIEIVAKYEFYVRKMAEDLKVFVEAFIIRNNIYPPEQLTKPNPKPTSLTPEDYKAALLAYGLDRHTYHKQIEGEKE